MVKLFNRKTIDLGNNDYNIILDLKENFTAAGGNWSIEECDDSSKLVVKNSCGLLNFDPYIIFQIDSDDRTLNIYPCKNYDSSKDNEDQEGTISNNGNTESFALKFDYLIGQNTNVVNLASNNSNFYFIFTDYSFYFFMRGWEGSYIRNYAFCYSIFNSLDKDTGGIWIFSTRHQTSDMEFLYYNDIWYGNTDKGIYAKKFIRDIDKSLGFRHYSSPTGATLATPISFFIDTNDDTSVNEWRYVGYSMEYYSLLSDTIVNVKQEDGTNKCCYIVGLSNFNGVWDLSHLNYGLFVVEDDLEIINN